MNRLPQEGDDVVIANETTVTLDLESSTPRFKSFTLGGGSATAKLLFTKWDAALVAETVTIAARGVMTCQGATKKENMGRVWVQCADMTIATGGKIDVDFCGYLAHKEPSSTGAISGYGPGAGQTHAMGASHGGVGGFSPWDSTYDAFTTIPNASFSNLLYDDPQAPIEPGSSGLTVKWKRDPPKWSKGGDGGGAVRLEATDSVTVDGEIRASGEGVTTGDNQYSQNVQRTAGSGGSVYITCRTFSGSKGVIRADGGNGHMRLLRPSEVIDGKQIWYSSVWGYDYPENLGDMAGGGGMIAIHYNAEAQKQDGNVSGMTISAAGGLFGDVYCCRAPTRANDDRYWTHADLGTVYFTDDTLVRDLLGKGLSGQILGFTEWTCDNLNFTSGAVRFMGEGFRLKVTGDLMVSGENTHLSVGGVAMTNRVYRTEVWAGRETVGIEVGGNLTVQDGGRLDIRSAETNDTVTVGAVVAVGKTLTIGNKGWFYAYCDPVNGGSPVFNVENLAVNEGGQFLAQGLGFAAAAGRNNGAADRYWNSRFVGYGPTPGFNSSVPAQGWADYTYADGTVAVAPVTGGSHGGLGGLSTTALDETQLKYATTSDDRWRPTLPGSGAGAAAMSLFNGAGGGVIRVHASNHIQVDGTVNADAGRTWTNAGTTGGGAGGTIYLTAKTFAGKETGLLTARGGDIGFLNNGNGGVAVPQSRGSGAGGGGRIAVWVGTDFPRLMTNHRVHTYDTAEAANAEASSFNFNFLGQATASGGTNEVATLSAEAGATLNGGDGTIGFVRVDPKGGSVLLVR